MRLVKLGENIINLERITRINYYHSPINPLTKEADEHTRVTIYFTGPLKGELETHWAGDDTPYLVGSLEGNTLELTGLVAKKFLAYLYNNNLLEVID